MPTDAEVATCFLRGVTESTGGTREISPQQLGYVLGIYAEATAYFRNSPYVTVSLAAFFLYYCGRPDATISLLGELTGQRGTRLVGVDYVAQFASYRLWHAARAALGHRESAHFSSLQRARMYHRQALVSTRDFWGSLVAYAHGRQVGLIVISNALAKQRRRALEAYRSAVSMNRDDIDTLTGPVAFLEEVLGSNEVAGELRRTLQCIEDAKRTRRAATPPPPPPGASRPPAQIWRRPWPLPISTRTAASPSTLTP